MGYRLSDATRAAITDAADRYAAGEVSTLIGRETVVALVEALAGDAYRAGRRDALEAVGGWLVFDTDAPWPVEAS